jgi:cytochrome P450
MNAALKVQDIPSHVPPELVCAFDVRNDPGFKAHPHERMAELAGRFRVFYTPIPAGGNPGGNWFLTRGEDIRAALQDPQTFSSEGARSLGKDIGDSWVLVPIDYDPPRHSAFRTIMNPLFSPSRMKVLEERVEARAIEYVERLRGQTSCEFIRAFARPFPVSIFLELMGLPAEETDAFVEWEEMILHAADPEVRTEGVRRLRDYLAGVIAARRKQPTDDLISFAVTSRIDGRPLDHDEIMGMCVLFFMAGLDTVTSSFSFAFRYLAEHPKAQAQLRADPALIPDAMEELLRAFAVVTTRRTVTRAVDIAGVTFKAGDIVVCPMMAASRDPGEFHAPDEVILDRAPNRHSAFGFGPHRCIGSHLARRELVAGVRQWLGRLPPFRMAVGEAPIATGSGVVCLADLRLRWD